MLPGEVSRSRVHLLYSHPRKGNRDSANFAMRMSENSEWAPPWAPPRGRDGTKSVISQPRVLPNTRAQETFSDFSDSLYDGVLGSSSSIGDSVSTTHLPTPWLALRSYGLVQHVQEPPARGLLDDLDVGLVLVHARDLVVVDDRLTSAPLPARLHGHGRSQRRRRRGRRLRR
jgi:hypothetical protein